MLCICSYRKRCVISDKEVITLMEMLWDSFYSYVQPFSFLKNDFCSPNSSQCPRVSKRMGKPRVLEGKACWFAKFLFR